MKIQKITKGKTRKSVSSSVIKEIRAEVEHCAKKFNCSMSFVVATALADAFGIEMEKYFESSKGRKLRRVK